MESKSQKLRDTSGVIPRKTDRPLDAVMPNNKSKRLNGKSGRKNLPLLKFEEITTKVISSFAAELPRTFGTDDLADVINAYLDLASKPVRLHLAASRRFSINAVKIFSYFHQPFVGKNWELIDQPDFKASAEVLLTDDNFQMLNELIPALGKQASELGLGWDAAQSAIRRIAETLRPDRRPERVRKGALCEQVITELKGIRSRKGEFNNFAELKSICSDFEVVRLLDSSPFDDEDRDNLAHPNRWETPNIYAYGVLKRHFLVNSDHTITAYRKTFKISLKHPSAVTKVRPK